MKAFNPESASARYVAVERMKASEMRDQLDRLIEAHGDCNVVVYLRNSESTPTEVAALRGLFVIS